MERFINHLAKKFSTKEHRLLFEENKEAPNAQAEPTPEETAKTPADDAEVRQAAAAVQGNTESRLAVAESQVANPETAPEGEPKTHAERITRGITAASKNYKEGKEEAVEASDELATAQKELEAAKQNPADEEALTKAQEKVDAAQAKLESAKQKQLQSAIEMIAYIFDLIARLFDGSLLDDPNKEEEEKEDEKDKPSDTSNSPTQIVKEAIKNGEAGTVEQIRTNLTTERVATTEKIQGNTTRIKDIRDRTTRLKTDEKTLKAEEDSLRSQLTNEKDDAKRKELEIKLKEVDAKHEAIVIEIAQNEILIQSLEDDNNEQRDRIIGIDRALKEVVQPLQTAVGQLQETLGLTSAPQIVNNGTINFNVNGLQGVLPEVLTRLGITPDKDGNANVNEAPETTEEAQAPTTEAPATPVETTPTPQNSKSDDSTFNN